MFYEHFAQQNKFIGVYSFEIFMYRVDDGEYTLVNRYSAPALDVNTSFVKEFSVSALDDIGMNTHFVVFDNTAYSAGMHPLTLLAYPNNSDTPIRIPFNFNTGTNLTSKRIEFDVPRFKSCVFEFDTADMRSKLIY
jgi:hypothetical protein